jgi:hypothetical protein
LNIVDEAGTQTPRNYKETFFYMIYRILFSRNFCIEKFTVQVYVLPSLFIAVNYKAKQTYE